MYTIDASSGNHVWDKTNLVTIVKGRRSYDTVVCKGCGIKGKRYNFHEVAVDGRVKASKITSCPNPLSTYKAPKKIKIKTCGAFGRQFVNLVSGSEHEVVTPPEGYQNDHTGVWVMGVGEPVKVLKSEFEIIS